MKNVLVTGGAGFIGSHLVDALVARGHRVRILDALVPQVHGNQSPAHLHPHAELIVGDINDREKLRHALRDIDMVFHHAAEVGVGQSMYEPLRYMRANTLGTTALLEEIAHAERKVERLIVASSMSIYGEGEYECTRCGRVGPQLRSSRQLAQRQWDIECPQCSGKLTPVPTRESKPVYPGSVYAISKQDQEQLCLVMGRAYHIPTVALRYFNVYGTRQALSNPYTGLCAIFASRLLNDNAPMVFEDGEQSRDLVHVSDIVQANLLAMERREADYLAINVGTGQSMTVNDVARILARGLNKPITAQITNQYREGDIRHCFADISVARKTLGYSPQVQLEEGMQELIAWLRDQTAVDRVPEMHKQLAAHNLMR